MATTYLTSAQLVSKYGDPAVSGFEKRNILLYPLPKDITMAIKTIPQKLYINQAIAEPLTQTLRALINKGLHLEIVSWDGCYVFRMQRGASVVSMHSFGIAIDLNAHDNPLYIFPTGMTQAQRDAIRAEKVKFSPEFIQVWETIGWRAGAHYINRIDGMHFEWLH